MQVLKRNQVEEAISRLWEPKAQEPTPELRTKLKRLLEADRNLGRTLRSRDAEVSNYAFYSDEAPGSGVENWFSEYEAFALFMALQIMAHGWTQGFAVSVLRRLRNELERKHSQILKMDETVLFDQDAIRRNAKPGDFAFNTTFPVLLTIISLGVSDANETPLCSICDGVAKTMRWVQEKTGGKHFGFTMFELVSPIFALNKNLAQSLPRPRGRPG